MDSGYLGLLILILIAGLLCSAMIFGSWFLGPKKRTPYKVSPYECGVAPVGDARERFPIKFYLVAILFVLFDIEIVFLWGWMTAFRSASGTEGGAAFMVFSFIEVLIHMSTWILGYIYAMRVGAINWDEATNLPKLQPVAQAEPIAPSPVLQPAVGGKS